MPPNEGVNWINVTCVENTTGASDSPIYLWINDDEVEIRDASKVWGKNTDVTTDELLKATDEKAQVACIGPAGENLINMAAIMTDKHRAAGRGGVGAVMGSKKLKAMAIRNKSKAKITAAEPEKLKAAREKFLKDIKASGFHQGLTAAGTSGDTSFLVSIGDSPTKNWNSTGLDSMPTCKNLDSANMDKYKLDIMNIILGVNTMAQNSPGQHQRIYIRN